MANSGNGTFIPMVSATPPPMDDGAFDFEDDDEFSGFSSAPYGPGFDSPPGKWMKNNNQNSGDSHHSVKSNTSGSFHSKSDQHFPSNDSDDFGTFATFDKSSSNDFFHNHNSDNHSHISNDAFRNVPVNGNKGGDDDGDEFADFASFKRNSSHGISFDEESLEAPKSETSNDFDLTLNKNNSHQKFSSSELDSFTQKENTSAVAFRDVLENNNEDSKVSEASVLRRNNLQEMEESKKLPEQRIGNSCISQSGNSEQIDDDGERNSLRNQKSAQDSKNTGTFDQEKGEIGFKSARLSEKPSMGSLHLFQEGDQQTFDSGIDSVMTPSDSSPEGKDETPSSTTKGISGHSIDLSPAAEGEEWSQFDTYSSKQSDNSREDGSSNSDATKTDRTETVETDDFGDFGSFSQPEIGESDSERNNVKENETGRNSESKLQMQLDQESGDDFGNFTNGSNVNRGMAAFRNDKIGNFGSISKEQNQLNDNADDGFGDFGSDQTEQKELNLQGDDDFGDFGKATTIQKDSNVDNDDEFGDFGNIPKIQRNNIDDDDDFGDFSSVSKGSASGDTISQSSRQEFEDFGDFESTKSSDSGNRSTQDKPADDWSGFSSGVSSNPSEAESFGDFGAFGSSSSLDKNEDFGSFGSVPAQPSSTSANQSNTSSSRIPPGARVERLFHSCFPNSSVMAVDVEAMPDPVVIILESVVSTPDVSTQKEVAKHTKTKEKKSANGSKIVVWSSLSDMENTLAQKYHWNSSKNSGKLLSSLGIDSRNILSASRMGMPLFAQGVGMLTPSKPGETSKRAPSGGEEQGSELEESAQNGLTLSEDAPTKVEFDWSNSGLTNPLDAVQKVDPEILDLAVKSLDPPTKPSSSTTGQSSSSTSSQKPNALDEILKHSSSSMVKQKAGRESGLTTEANSVLDSMPDLSFMLAKVLMFPVSSPTKGESKSLATDIS